MLLLEFGQVPWTVIMMWFLDVSTCILGVQIRKMRKRSFKEVCKLPGAGFDRERWRHLINCLYWEKAYTPTASTLLLALPALADPLFWCPFRLILPYERFIKGEEDKPLPPIKPRKQENNSQENENKTKVSGAKRIKHELSKSKKEKENAPKPQDASEVSCAPPQKSLGRWGLPRGLLEPCTQSLIPAQDNTRLWTLTIWTSQVPQEWAFRGSASVEWDRPRIGSGRKQKHGVESWVQRPTSRQKESELLLWKPRDSDVKNVPFHSQSVWGVGVTLKHSPVGSAVSLQNCLGNFRGLFASCNWPLCNSLGLRPI